MMGRRIRFAHVALALPALTVATSCVPQLPVKTVATLRMPPPAPLLLKQLDLRIPADLAASMRPVALDPTPALTAIPAAPPFLVQTRTSDDTARALDCLTAAVYYEARSQSVDGQRAVAQVVLNRVRDRAFPASVCGVVYQGSNRTTGCQFSFTCDGSLYHPREPLAWARARVIAAAALSGEVYAPVGSATFYHANYVSPWWAGSMTQVVTVGAHVFYRWRGAMENALAFTQSYSGAEPAAGGSRPAVLSAGVEVHYGTELVEGVTIHRPGGVVAPTAEPAVARTALVEGVHVHRGEPAPDVTGASASDDRTI